MEEIIEALDKRMKSESRAFAGWSEYYNAVLEDYRELVSKYPFSRITFPPTLPPSQAIIRVIAASKELIEAVNGVEEDFCGKYTKELYVVVPYDYRNAGCNVYGGKWINRRKLKSEDQHFYSNQSPPNAKDAGPLLCVGTPEAFPLMSNVILENVRTAGNMLIAYEKIMRGESDTLELKAYEHGDLGRNHFKKDLRRKRIGGKTNGKKA